MISRLEPGNPGFWADRISFILILVFLFSINFSIALCYLVFSAFLITAAVTYFRTGRKIVLPPFFLYLAVFSALTLISTLFSIDRLNSLRENKELFLYFLIPVFMLILNNRGRFRKAVIAVLYSAALSSATGIVISLKEGISLSHRLKGFSSHWMTYSGLLAMVFVFFLVFNIYEKNGKKRMIHFLILGVILASVLLSLTRSAWMGIFISTGLFFIYRLRRRPALIAAGAVLAAVFLLLLPGSIKSRLISVVDIHNETNKDRIFMAYAAARIVGDFPLTGVGSDNVKAVYPEYRHPDATKNNPHLHNNFFQIAAERGIPGVLAFIGFILSLFLDLMKKIRRGDGTSKRISLAAFFMLLSFVISGMFEYNFGDTEIKFLLLFFITLPYLTIPAAEETAAGKNA